MKIITEKSLSSFDFWCTMNHLKLTASELRRVERILNDLYPDGIDETQLNDIFRFDFDMICDWLGYTLDDYAGVIRNQKIED